MWRPLVALRGRKNRRANVPERDGLYGLVPVITTPKASHRNVVAFVGQYTTVGIPLIVATSNARSTNLVNLRARALPGTLTR